MGTSPSLITGDWKISRVLEVYPVLLDTLTGMSPAFTRLRNPLLRKVQSRLVTVEQAARIANLEPSVLVRELNVAAGFDTATVQTLTGDRCVGCGSEPEWVGNAPVDAEIDAQAIFDRGEEPFGPISQAAQQVPEGAVLRILVGFEPVPLYDALAKLGFSHWTIRLDADRWQVDFYRERRVNSRTSNAAEIEVQWTQDQVDVEVTIDVSELVPPEPMVKILTAMTELPDGRTLRVHHVRRPIHLYPQLDDLGYPHHTRELGPQQVELLIHKPARPGEEL
jgi:uncharacterized protein (DUF2249 family)